MSWRGHVVSWGEAVKIRQAIDVLTEYASFCPTVVESSLARYAALNPNGLRALMKLAGDETLGNVVAAARQQSRPLVIGQPVTDPGVPFSQLIAGGNTIKLNLIPDFLRDSSGKIVQLTADQAVDAVTAFNGGFKHGNGYEKANSRAVAQRQFQNGTLILARAVDLRQVAVEYPTNPDLKNINNILLSSSAFAPLFEGRCVSCTEDPEQPHFVSRYDLLAPGRNYVRKDEDPGRVLVLRGLTCG